MCAQGVCGECLGVWEDVGSVGGCVSLTMIHGGSTSEYKEVKVEKRGRDRGRSMGKGIRARQGQSRLQREGVHAADERCVSTLPPKVLQERQALRAGPWVDDGGARERCRFIVNCAESLATELSASQLTASQAASSACHAALPAIQLNL